MSRYTEGIHPWVGSRGGTLDATRPSLFARDSARPSLRLPVAAPPSPTYVPICRRHDARATPPPLHPDPPHHLVDGEARAAKTLDCRGPTSNLLMRRCIPQEYHLLGRYDHVCLVHEIFYFDEAEKQARCTDSRRRRCASSKKVHKTIAPAATAHAHDPAAARRHTYPSQSLARQGH
jgi:hypothetical protein